jgi:snapc4 protein, putative
MTDFLECDETQSSSDNESDSLDYDISQLPKSVLSCWALNHAYQQSLKDLKKFLEIKLEENRIKQEELNLDLNEDEPSSSTSSHSSFHANSLICFMSPYFKDIKGLHPPPNEDVTIKKMKGEINQANIRTKSFWRANDKKKLIELVKLASFKKSLEPLKKKENSLISQIKVSQIILNVAFLKNHLFFLLGNRKRWSSYR